MLNVEVEEGSRKDDRNPVLTYNGFSPLPIPLLLHIISIVLLQIM
jgi:hypothetical protein